MKKYKKFKSINDINMISFPKFNWEIKKDIIFDKYYSLVMGEWFETITFIFFPKKNRLSVIKSFNGNYSSISFVIKDVDELEKMVESVSIAENLEIMPLYKK